MKKMKLLMALSFVAGIASADIAVTFDNGAQMVTTDGTTFVDQALAQLIWSPNAPIAQAGIGGALGSGEYMLRSFVTTSGYGGTWSDRHEGVMPYTDADVGGVSINTGYFFVRLFDNAALANGDHYLQQAVEGSSLTAYDAQSAATFYSTENGLTGADTQIGLTGGDLSTSSYTIAIPEPAVAGLVGIFGLGLIGIRRIFQL